MEETWYKARAGNWKSNIDPVVVVKETGSFIILKGDTRKSAKRGLYENYFKTWDEAKAFLLENAEIDVTHAKDKLQSARSYLGNIQSLKPPQERSKPL